MRNFCTKSHVLACFHAPHFDPSQCSTHALRTSSLLSDTMAEWNRNGASKARVDTEDEKEDDDHSALVCPITCEPIVDPVVDPEGFAYERHAILSWVVRHQTSPMTRSPLLAHELSPLLDNLRLSSNRRTPNSMQLFVRILLLASAVMCAICYARSTSKQYIVARA